MVGEGSKSAHCSSEVIFHLIFGEFEISVVDRLTKRNGSDHTGFCFLKKAKCFVNCAFFFHLSE